MLWILGLNSNFLVSRSSPRPLLGSAGQLEMLFHPYVRSQREAFKGGAPTRDCSRKKRSLRFFRRRRRRFLLISAVELSMVRWRRAPGFYVRFFDGGELVNRLALTPESPEQVRCRVFLGRGLALLVRLWGWHVKNAQETDSKKDYLPSRLVLNSTLQPHRGETNKYTKSTFLYCKLFLIWGVLNYFTLKKGIFFNGNPYFCRYSERAHLFEYCSIYFY